MQTIEKLQSRIDALDFYYSNHFGNCPTVNVKVHGRIKEIDEVADTMKLKEPFKSQAVEIVKLRDREDYGNYFWNVCEREGEYAMDVIFEGVTHNSDEPEQKHIVAVQREKRIFRTFWRSLLHWSDKGRFGAVFTRRGRRARRDRLIAKIVRYTGRYRVGTGTGRKYSGRSAGEHF